MNHTIIPGPSRPIKVSKFLVLYLLINFLVFSQEVDTFSEKVVKPAEVESEGADSRLELKNWISGDLLQKLTQRFPAIENDTPQKYWKIVVLSGNNPPKVIVWKFSQSGEITNDEFYLVQYNTANPGIANSYSIESFRVSSQALLMLYQNLNHLELSAALSAPNKPDQIAVTRWIFAISYGDDIRFIHRVAPLNNRFIEFTNKEKTVNELVLRTIGQVLISIAEAQKEEGR
jgi:hypothetical protein